jgi:hypothetical protein
METKEGDTSQKPQGEKDDRRKPKTDPSSGKIPDPSVFDPVQELPPDEGDGRKTKLHEDEVGESSTDSDPPEKPDEDSRTEPEKYYTPSKGIADPDESGLPDSADFSPDSGESDDGLSEEERLRLQEAINQQSQILSMMSNMAQRAHQTMMSVIENMR